MLNRRWSILLLNIVFGDVETRDMKNFIILLFQIVLILANEEYIQNRFQVYKTTDEEFFLLRHGDTHFCAFPNIDSVKLIVNDVENVTLKSAHDLKTFDRGAPLPSLIPTNIREPDEIIRVILDRALIFDPAAYWLDRSFIDGSIFPEHFYPKTLNPSMIWWNEIMSLVLISYRTQDVDSKIVMSLAYLEMSSSNAFKLIDSDSSNEDMNHHSRTSNHAIHFELPKLVFRGNKFASQEDPRLLLLRDNRILVCFNGVVAKFDLGYHGDKTGFQYFSIGAYNATSNTLAFGPSVVLHHGTTHHQKNWMPFEYCDNGTSTSTVYYIQSLDPLHIVTVDTDNPPRLDGNANDNMIATLRTVCRTEHSTLLPWIANQLLVKDLTQPNPNPYGDQIRGGSPALLVRGFYLAFFHTSAFVSARTVYFMGAVLLCPHFPFHIHKMSAQPIVGAGKAFYEGQWSLNSKFSYVVFPTGFVLTRDGRHLLLSMGYQDKDGYVVRLEIDGLFASMDLVEECVQ